MGILFLHGLGDDATAWDAMRATHMFEETVTYFPSLARFGGTEWDGGGLEERARSVGSLLVGSSEPWVLVGHSLGGVIGTLVALDPPACLRGFISIEGNLLEDDCYYSAQAAAADDLGAWLDGFAEQMGGRYAGALKRCDPGAFRRWSSDAVALCAGDAMCERYAAARVPTLFIHGDSLPPATAGVVAGLGDTARHLAGAGHWVMDDAPAECATAITEWIASL